MLLAEVLGAVTRHRHLARADNELLMACLTRRSLREVVADEPLLQVHSRHRVTCSRTRRGPSFPGDDTSVDTGYPSMSEAGSGRRHGSTVAGAVTRGAGPRTSSLRSRITGIRL